MIVDRIMEAAAEKAAARADRPSRMGAWSVGRCVRQNWYMEHGYVGEPFQPRAILTFDLGDRVEDAIMHFIEESGVVDHIRTSDRKDTTTIKEIGLRVRPDFFFEAEVMDQKRLVVGEIKSMSDFGFERAEKGELDESYLCQAECYCRAFDVENVLFVLYRKETSHLHEILYARDEERWERIKQNVAAARGMLTPPRPYPLEAACKNCSGTGKTPTGRECGPCGGSALEPGGPYIRNFPCGYCSYRAECWGELEFVTDRKGKPRWKLKTGNGDAAAVEVDF